MKLAGDIVINGRRYAKGSEAPWYVIYPFFMAHMLVFGAVGFYLAYGTSQTNQFFLYVHGGFAIVVYTVLYLVIFGRDQVIWMFINAGLGVFGIYSQIGWFLSLFGKRIDDYPFRVNVVPFLYFVLYTFLIRHAFLDLMSAREDAERKKWAERAYVFVSMVICGVFLWLQKQRQW